jgi:hypothetical protein
LKKQHKQITKQGQQGDILFELIDKLPDGVEPVPPRDGRFIIADGETSGHSHSVIAEGCQLYELKGQLYLLVSAPVVHIDHQEHKQNLYETGIYKVGRVQEYDYFREMERKVID